jgi:hypothetical protein
MALPNIMAELNGTLAAIKRSGDLALSVLRLHPRRARAALFMDESVQLPQRKYNGVWRCPRMKARISR